MDSEQVQYQDQILDAIDQLRRRKARPDAERIFNCMFRRSGISSIESKVALEECVNVGSVLRVCYKGNISYRNAAKKYTHSKRDQILNGSNYHGKQGGKHKAHYRSSGHQDGPNLNSAPCRKFTNLLTCAFAELILQEPDYLDGGVPPSELIRTILEKDSVRYTKKYVSILLNKEVENGGLVRLENGNFLVGRNKPMRRMARKHPRKMGNNGHGKREFAGAFGDEPIEFVDLEAESFKYGQETSEKRLMRNEENYLGKASGAPNGNFSRTSMEHYKKEHFVGKGGSFAKDNSCMMQKDKDNEDMLNSDRSRVGGRRKKAKKVFDPSDSNMPKRRGKPLGRGYEKTSKYSDSDSRPESRASHSGREQGGVCSVCHNQSKKGPFDKMVSCRECSNKAHASCLNGDDMMLKMYPDNTWQCPHCKTCAVCYETAAATAGCLVVCSICADAYHIACHSPKITEKIKPSTKWLCNNCQMPEQLAVANIEIGCSMESNVKKIERVDSMSPVSSSPNYISFPPSPTLPTLSPQTNNDREQSPSSSDSKSFIGSFKEEDLEDEIDPSIPDASNWSPEEVTQYFEQYFPEEAQVFREQEINGHSLLLMKRMDVLKGLRLKLGPALKIYRHVLKLQYRRDDPKLYWV